ncbi:HD domain-containing protein [Thermosporothrix hazakensis]|jgi:hypothetical protein|uniref:HD domain-containing protein n=2 Tax=Thermosporothrix TaxID=768650 RepID=A0A326US08_THEHA|nr:HD domain-containing protein [Thermosporothrix hazakensis]PZW36669.1 HD domain-containing protein [Thermosporothrix hazakensis]BBH89137.1 hypothetical protein KTC_38880 [Thermosporothrix sp. COM3]GCE47320.1 hypothetical protein KTH_21890 [Thermosporothrix hazakensis]
MEENIPFRLETALERKIAADPEWLAGIEWGKPRAGHMEGPVKFHIADVLANIDAQHPEPEERRVLRLIALLHDTFKYQVDEHRPRIHSNHHAYRARCFAQRYISDPILLDLIELHDEAYNSWRLGAIKGDWRHAQERVDLLLARIGPALPLYIRFFLADSGTDSKDPAPVRWFLDYVRKKGFPLPPIPSRYKLPKEG